MRKTRGFKLRRRVGRLCKWVLTPGRKAGRYAAFRSPEQEPDTMTKICEWGRRLRSKLFRPPARARISGYSRIGDTCRSETETVGVPKGHLAVYVGKKEDAACRYLVPVIYFNHPLFGELLREAEKEYGYEHPGGITIPCRVSEFERVQMKIATGGGSRRQPSKKHRFLPAV